MKITREIKEGSIHSFFIENIDELLKDPQITRGCLTILPLVDVLIKKGHHGMMPFNFEENDEKYQLILLMKDVGLVNKIEEGRSENGESNILTFSFHPDKVRNFIDRANGKTAIIKKQTLEFIARQIGELDSGPCLVEFLKSLGVSEPLIVYPNTKWRMVYDVLLYYASSPSAEDHKMLFKIIEEVAHPLMHNGDKNLAAEMVGKFNNYLGYNNAHVEFNEEENRYRLYFALDEQEREDIMRELDLETIQKNNRHFDFLCQPENKEKVSLLRKNYQILMGVLETFCRNFLQLSHEDIVELNRHYLALDKDVWDAIDELKITTSFDTWKKYPRPFTNLFSAEKELNGEINWDVIRREMFARFGEIETVYQKVNASDILSEPDKQKQLNTITLYLSELKEKITTAKPKNVEKVKENFDGGSRVKDTPRAADHDISSPQKIIHQHTHKFENSVQEKEISLNHKIFEDLGKKKLNKERNKNVVCLTSSGDLYREPKNKYCYSMGEKDDRHKIVRFLITNKGFQPTSQISLQFEDKNEESVIDTIGKINSMTKGKLGIKDNIMLGKKGSGYRMNPFYAFALKNE